MKSNSKKHEGFTLIEIVISMAIIAIISVGVYDGYMIMIRQTKAGQVRQTSTLIGKQISEEIKSASENKEIKTSGVAGSLILELTDEIHFTENGDNYEIIQRFNEEGNLVDAIDRYTARVELVPKKTRSGKLTTIDEVLNSENIYIIKDNGQIKPVATKPINFSDIEGDITVDIKISANANSKIKIGENNLDYPFNNERINMDLKNCTGVVTINVTNETKTPLKLCVLNNNNAKIENIKGILNEYYRSESGSKIGVLYDVNIEIDDERSNRATPIFETSFVQNINIK